MTLEQLESVALPTCVADGQISQPFQIEGPDAVMMEAACGFRPYAINVNGDEAAIDALVQSSDLIADVAFASGID